MPMVRAMRMLNAVEAGTMNGAQLETLLTSDPGRLGELNVLLGMRGQARRLAASSTTMAAVIASSTAMAAVIASNTAMAAVAASSIAMAAVIASSTAMTAVIASSTAMAAVAASSTAMAAVIASSTAMTAVIASSTAMAAVAASSTAMAAVIASSTTLAAVISSSTAMAAVASSSTAMATLASSSTVMALVWASNIASDAILTNSVSKLAVYNSDTALAALQATPVQVARQIATSGRTTAANTATQSYVFVANGTKVILLRRYYSGTEFDMISWARGSTTAAVGQGPAGGGRNLDTGTQAVGCVSGSYTSNAIMPATNDDTANFVSAANGLQRRGWQSGASLYVIYIAV